MELRLDEIKGLMVDNLDLLKMKFPEQGVAWNQAIKKQGQRKITMNSENLEDIIARNLPYRCNEIGNVIRLRAAILSHLNELIESVPIDSATEVKE